MTWDYTKTIAQLEAKLKRQTEAVIQTQQHLDFLKSVQTKTDTKKT